jgi:hypothetical protein
MYPALVVTDLTDDELEDLLAQLEAERRRRWALRRRRQRAPDRGKGAAGPLDDASVPRGPVGGPPVGGRTSSPDSPEDR